jgi:hypothetical protein
MIPDSELIEYYLKITDGMNILAHKGTRYDKNDEITDKVFFGGCLSCTKKIFEQINGYPNNYYGWGGEDDDLGLRIYEEKIVVYKNSKGRVIDIEEHEGKVMTDVLEKIKLVKQDDNYNREKWEKLNNYKNYKNNGVNNLNYDILYEYEYDDTIHIIVDIMKTYDEKHLSQDYDLEDIDKKQYKKIRGLLFNIKVKLF